MMRIERARIRMVAIIAMAVIAAVVVGPSVLSDLFVDDDVDSNENQSLPIQEAKWTISGVVRSDVLLRDTHGEERTLRLWPGPVASGDRDPGSSGPLGKHSETGINVTVKGRLWQNADLSLPNVVITVARLERALSSSPLRESPILLRVDDIRGFHRRVITATKGDQIEIVSLGEQSVRMTYPGGGSRWDMKHMPNRTLTLLSQQSRDGQILSLKMGNRRMPLRCGSSCDIVVFSVAEGENDFAFLFLGDHHVHAVSDQDGLFRLPKLPDGEYEVVAIHEVLGRTSTRLKIEGKDPAPIDIVFDVPGSLRLR